MAQHRWDASGKEILGEQKAKENYNRQIAIISNPKGMTQRVVESQQKN